MIPLTAIQAQYLAFIKAMLIEEQRFPTIREMGKRFHSTSTNNVSDHLKRLAKKGAILMPDGARSRAIQVLGDRLHWQSDLSGWVFCPACVLVKSTEHQRYVIRLCADHNREAEVVSMMLQRPPT